jgi:hypothetical protein
MSLTLHHTLRDPGTVTRGKWPCRVFRSTVSTLRRINREASSRSTKDSPWNTILPTALAPC